ncbi:MAG: D-alanyl-D-alanine carboxypeptidase family protein [Bacillota bacterium]
MKKTLMVACISILLLSMLAGIGGAASADETLAELRESPFTGYQPDIELSAQSAMVVDLVTGDILFEKNADAKMGPASLVKIATLALLFQALEEGETDLEETVTVSERAWSANVVGSRMFIEVGEEIPLDLLIQGIAVASGNDACIAVAEHLGGSEAQFVSQMNELANRLAMEDTRFATPHGLPAEDQHTTARDIAKLARYFSLRYPEAEGYTSQQEFVYGVETPHRHWNGLLFKDDRVVGLKTGYTEESGFHLAATAREGEKHYLALVMGVGTDNSVDYAEGTAIREDEAGALLDWAFENFRLYDVPTPKEIPDSVRIFGGEVLEVDLEMESNRPPLSLPKGAERELVYRVSVDEPLRAPLGGDEEVGSVRVFWQPPEEDDEVLLARWSIHPTTDVAIGGLWRRFVDWLILLFNH